MRVTYENPIRYRGYRIYPGDFQLWQFVHEDYDGDGDHRCGDGTLIIECINQINEMESENELTTLSPRHQDPIRLVSDNT